MQCLALLVFSLAAVYIGWADVRVAAGQETALAYAARLLVCLAGMTLLYAVVVARWIGPQSDWYEAVRRTSLVLAAATIGTLVVVLALEVVYFEPGVGAPIAAPEVIAISVMLCGFVVALFSMALWPGKDPLNLTEKGRTAYVYAAQFVAAVLFAHMYLAEPQLFETGLFRRYWPYIVMLLAFGSGAFGEICTRRNWRVIAEPMLRTGGFLPLLPALAAWAFSETSYPLVLFFAGLVYVFFALTRRSFVAGVAAAVMGNGALWALLSDQGCVLRAQPQFWLIPPALSVLVAAHVNRARLSDAALTRRAVHLRDDHLPQFGRRDVHEAGGSRRRRRLAATDYPGQPGGRRHFCRHPAARPRVSVPGCQLPAAVDRGHGVECRPTGPAYVALVGVRHHPGPGDSGGVRRVRKAPTRSPVVDRPTAAMGCVNNVRRGIGTHGRASRRDVGSTSRESGFAHYPASVVRCQSSAAGTTRYHELGRDRVRLPTAFAIDLGFHLIPLGGLLLVRKVRPRGG